MRLDSRINELLSRWERHTTRPTPEELCADCPELLDELRHHISRLERADALLKPAGPTPGADTPPPAPSIAGYEIGDILGEGGMGTVWRAVQVGTRRPVALKVMNAAGRLSSRSRERFRREVELASRLDHPHIAQVYDGDVRGGVCYYAMQLIDGLPLDEFVQQRQLSRRAILELMQSICLAIQFAHQRGIIHRDLKPSNIMVDGAGEPHVLDFGLAKDLRDDLQTSVSMEGAVPGTPAFMSPEQAAGRSDLIDTRSDIYSLGVILYRLIVGQLPHETTGSSMQLLRRIAEQDPRPPRQLDPSIDRDLEAMMLRALEVNPAARYGSAAEFAEDLDNYLHGRPVRARPRTYRYVFAKWLRRHRYRAAVAAAVMVLLGGLAVWSYVSIARQRTRAETNAAINKAVNTFILEKLLRGVDPAHARGKDPSLADLLHTASREIESAFPDQPLVEASIRRIIGQTYMNIIRLAEAETHLTRAWQIHRQILGDDDPETLRSAAEVAFFYESVCRTDEAAALLEPTLERQRHLLGLRHPDTLSSIHRLGNVTLYQGKREQSVALLRQALAGRRAVLGESHPDTIWSMTDLGAVLGSMGQHEEAESLLRRGLELRLATYGPDHPDTLNAELNLASELRKQGRLDEAEALYLENVKSRQRVYTPSHAANGMPLQGLGTVYRMRGDLHKAAEYFRRAIEVRGGVGGPTYGEAMRSALDLCDVLLLAGRPVEAAATLDEVAAALEVVPQDAQLQPIRQQLIELRQRATDATAGKE